MLAIVGAELGVLVTLITGDEEVGTAVKFAIGAAVGARETSITGEEVGTAVMLAIVGAELGDAVGACVGSTLVFTSACTGAAVGAAVASTTPGSMASINTPNMRREVRTILLSTLESARTPGEPA